MDIITFLTARLDEAKALAEAAHAIDPAPWTAGVDEEGPGPEYRNVRGNGLVIAADEIGLWDTEGSHLLCMTVPTTRHVAYWDPARVLRYVAGARRMLATLVEMRAQDGWGFHAFADQLERALAAPYDDHPDYDPAWALPIER